MLCPSCSSQVNDGSRFCGDCGSSVDPRSATTRATVGGGTTSAPSFDEARFLPGTMVGGRYRIVGLLGKGGMGEVYRADDLKLGQPVALKFLPAGLADDRDRLNRFLNEVRIARQVSHPSVCRVHDVGEAEGHHYLSMEYVDGEDLATLLRRIGRLPGDKAVQIARQLCAGLAAAHEVGILHRDIKPANVMIDGRGRAKLTDFGLAGLVEAFEGAEVRAGTPTYMAPEQLAGKSVSIQSDIYSLGLVLYELFTGKRAWDAGSLAELTDLQRDSTPTRPASFMDGFDPAVERVIFLCLEKDPADRPQTALAVAAALPGGDPLAAALAAGETPSPEMVAAAGPAGGLRAGVAVACFVAAVLGVALLFYPAERSSIYGRLPFVKSYEALQENAREIARQLGYDTAPSDTAAWYSLNMNEYLHQLREGGVEGLSESMSQPGQFMVSLAYRQGEQPIPSLFVNGRVGWNEPAPDPGDVAMILDLQGHLAALRAVPERMSDAEEPAGETDWSVLFRAAGLDIEQFEPVAPTLLPSTFADDRAAWSGVLPEHADRPVRVEAAAYRGRPVFFNKVISSDSAWSTEDDDTAPSLKAVFIPLLVILIVLVALLVGGGLFLTIRNLRLGRGDRKGAMRLALVVFSLRMLHWILAGDHVGHPVELITLGIVVCGAVTLGVLSWIVYVAFEPYVRRFWPESIVSWSRLIAGRFRDPLVGRDVLIGSTVAATISAITAVGLWLACEQDLLGPLPVQQPLILIRGGRFAVGQMFSVLLSQTGAALGLMLLFLLFRMIFRKTWIAAVVLSVLQGTISLLNFQALGGSAAGLLGAVLGIISIAVIITVLIRFGMVALLSLFVFSGFLNTVPWTLDLSAPFFGTGLLVLIAALAIPTYGLTLSLRGHSHFSPHMRSV